MNLDQLLAAMDNLAVEKPRAVHIKGLGDVHIREITIGEMDEQIADTADKKDKRGVARGACRLLSDENGKRLLDPENVEHVARMAKLPLRVLVAINKASDDAAGN
jgi:hypothetical protein